MQAFIEVVKIHFKSYFQYKWTFAMSFFTQPIIFIINYIVFQSIYRYGEKDAIQGYSIEQMVWFFTANLLVNAFVWNPTVGSMSDKILSGKLTRDLLRPISVFQYEMADCVASRCVSLLVDFLPGLVLYSLILPPKFLTVWSFLKFLIVVIPAFFLNYLTASLIGICAMWVKNSTSLHAVSNVMISFVGGSLIPMEFYPEVLRRLTDFLPYKYIYYWPIQFFLNKGNAQSGEFFLWIIAIQLGWIGVLWVLYQIGWKQLLRTYGAVG